MYCDFVLMEKNEEAEKFGRELGFGKIYFREDFENFGIVLSKDYNTDRGLVEKRKLKILLNPHVNNLRDSLHFRSSGLNHVLCKLCYENNVSVGFSLDSALDAKLLGRIKQNIKLCRKYGVKMRFFSFAKNKFEMRGREDMLAFLRSIGMTGKEAKDALSC